LTEADTLYASTPLFYMLATILGVVPTLLVRSKIRIAPRFSASQYWDDIRACGATVAHSVFSVIPILLKQPPSPLDRQHNCRALFIAKSNAEFEERFGVRLIEIYGSTEMNIVAYNPWDEPKAGSCGKPAPNFEVKIVDDDDNELPVGETGEIVARPLEPFSISYGYYKRPEITVEMWRNLWFHCGDRGYFDEDGYLFYVDRKKDVIRRGGENISSYELERQVNSHPLVLESAAIPVPSELGEDEVKVCVVLQPGADVGASELLEHVSELVPRFMAPRYLEFVAELPRTGSLKIEKYKLQQDGLNERTFDRKTAGYVVP
jgi:crotonobetaine/carnitine-CoA ligase